jgi:hypothetical protein
LLRGELVPRIIDYSAVLTQTDRQGLVSLYYNSGAFGFPESIATHAIGWIAGDDPSLRPAARPLAVTVAPPPEATLARLATAAWLGKLPGDAWLLPKANWAYELDFGSAAWMPKLLRDNRVDVSALESRHDGCALAFAPDESPAFSAIVEGLLTNLLGSDFQLMFPGRDVVCTLHHHKQLWWTSPDESLITRLRAMV